MGHFSRIHTIPTAAKVYALFCSDGKHWYQAAKERWGSRISQRSLSKLLKEGKKNAAAVPGQPAAQHGEPAASIPSGGPSRPRITDSEFEGALSVTGGHSGKAAALLGCTPQAVYRYNERQRDLGL